jgi:molybdenum cofactor cytidylyltransferase
VYMPKIPHLLLAAGNSKRMGQPKQLLPWGDKTLIEHQVQIRLQTHQYVMVVLGSNSDIILPHIEKLPVTVIVNNEWANGMGNSIAYGIKMLNKKFPNVNGVLISLLDQPLVTSVHLENIIGSFQPGNKQIIVSQSESGWKGVPALFDQYYFEVLSKLNGEEGAKKIIQKYPDFVKCITCGNILEDIDTPEAYHELLKGYIF